MKSLKSVAKKLTAVLLFLVFLALSGVLVYSSQVQKTSAADYIDRLEILKSTEGQKAIFIGGSATAYGVHAEQFEEETGINSVNMGHYADCNFSLMLSSVEPYLNNGDIVFLMPEYGYYSKNWNDVKSEMSFDTIFYFNPSLVSRLSILQVFDALPSWISTGWSSWNNALQETVKATVFHGDFGIYYRGGINRNGDAVSHKDKSQKSFAETSVDFQDNGFSAELKSSIEKVEQKGVTVFLLYPPFESASFDASQQSILEISEEVQHITDETKCRTLFSPFDARYDKSWFFDTCYHLTYDKGILFTQMIIEEYLGDILNNESE